MIWTLYWGGSTRRSSEVDLLIYTRIFMEFDFCYLGPLILFQCCSGFDTLGVTLNWHGLSDKSLYYTIGFYQLSLYDEAIPLPYGRMCRRRDRFPCCCFPFHDLNHENVFGENILQLLVPNHRSTAVRRAGQVAGRTAFHGHIA